MDTVRRKTRNLQLRNRNKEDSNILAALPIAAPSGGNFTKFCIQVSIVTVVKMSRFGRRKSNIRPVFSIQSFRKYPP